MHKAFSLVELSIVLVILGLLTGGILAGQSLIRAAELRAVSSEYNRYLTATSTFRDKYFGLPGDLTNASKFWGPLDGGDGVNTDCRAEQPGLPTCNGNGNGQVEYGNNSVNTYESHLVWKHLANAGLIEGSYTGSPATFAGNSLCPTTYSYMGGCNAPASKLGGTKNAWFIIYRGPLVGDGYLFNGEYGHTVYLMGNANNPIGPDTPVMRAEELWNLDVKMDDGKPATGNIVAARWNICTTGAANAADGANASYALTTSDNRCMPVFRNTF